MPTSIVSNPNPPNSPLDTTYGKVFPNPSSNPTISVLARHLNRYLLQEHLRELLFGENFGTRCDSDGVIISKQHRATYCLRNQIRAENSVRLYRRKVDSRPYYGGLMICGSAWVCPVCSAKIAERRRVELERAIKAWQCHTMPNRKVVLLTLTIPHTRKNSAAETVERYTKTAEHLWSGRGWMKVRETIGYFGRVSALEVTHSLQHGWHPHGHVILFLDTDLPIEEIRSLLWERYQAAYGVYLKNHPSSEKRRLSPDAFHLQNGERAARYATKYGREDLPEEEQEYRWGIAQELTRANSKKTKSHNGRTPFQLLADSADGDGLAGKLFIEYAHAIFGRHQLRWSTGLKYHILGENDVSDEEIAKSVDAHDELLGNISPVVWKVILRHKLRQEVLRVAAPKEATLNNVLELIKPHLSPDQQPYIDDDQTLILTPRVDPEPDPDPTPTPDPTPDPIPDPDSTPDPTPEPAPKGHLMNGKTAYLLTLIYTLSEPLFVWDTFRLLAYYHDDLFAYMALETKRQKAVLGTLQHLGFITNATKAQGIHYLDKTIKLTPEGYLEAQRIIALATTLHPVEPDHTAA